jgi:hypothetical protein
LIENEVNSPSTEKSHPKNKPSFLLSIRAYVYRRCGRHLPDLNTPQCLDKNLFYCSQKKKNLFYFAIEVSRIFAPRNQIRVSLADWARWTLVIGAFAIAERVPPLRRGRALRSIG